jgi:hypothetical protein
MVFYGIVIAGLVGFVAWFVRTPLFRAHLRHGTDPGEAGTRVEGKFPRNGGDYYYDE